MSASERHYSVLEVAELWKLCPDSVRAIFKNTPGVIRINRPATRKKRKYVTLRIPQSVLDRVHLNLTKVA